MRYWSFAREWLTTYSKLEDHIKIDAADAKEIRTKRALLQFANEQFRKNLTDFPELSSGNIHTAIFRYSSGLYLDLTAAVQPDVIVEVKETKYQYLRNEWYVAFADKYVAEGLFSEAFGQCEKLAIEFIEVAHVLSLPEVHRIPLRADEALIVTNVRRHAVLNIEERQLATVLPRNIRKCVARQSNARSSHMIFLDNLILDNDILLTGYDEPYLLRVITKLYVAFQGARIMHNALYPAEKVPVLKIHTGHLGTGSKGHHPWMSFLLQYIAAQLAGVQLIYHALPLFRDKRFDFDECLELVDLAHRESWSCRLLIQNALRQGWLPLGSEIPLLVDAGRSYLQDLRMREDYQHRCASPEGKSGKHTFTPRLGAKTAVPSPVKSGARPLRPTLVEFARNENPSPSVGSLTHNRNVESVLKPAGTTHFYPPASDIAQPAELLQSAWRRSRRSSPASRNSPIRFTRTYSGATLSVGPSPKAWNGEAVATPISSSSPSTPPISGSSSAILLPVVPPVDSAPPLESDAAPESAQLSMHLSMQREEIPEGQVDDSYLQLSERPAMEEEGAPNNLAASRMLFAAAEPPTENAPRVRLQVRN